MEKVKETKDVNDNGYDHYKKHMEDAQNWYMEAFQKPFKDRTPYEKYVVKSVSHLTSIIIESEYSKYLLTTQTKNYHGIQKKKIKTSLKKT